MKKTPAGKSGHARLIRRCLYLIVLVFAAVTLIWDPFHLVVRKGTAARKAEIFQFVNGHIQDIVDDVENHKFTRSIFLLAKAGFEPEVESPQYYSGYARDKWAVFKCCGTEGFYYTPYDKPGDMPGRFSPWMKFDGALGEEIQQNLEQVGNEWVWYERGKLITVIFNQFEYHTEKICDNLWYYQMFFRND